MGSGFRVKLAPSSTWARSLSSAGATPQDFARHPCADLSFSRAAQGFSHFSHEAVEWNRWQLGLSFFDRDGKIYSLGGTI
jgi:hypothetical protein